MPRRGGDSSFAALNQKIRGYGIRVVDVFNRYVFIIRKNAFGMGENDYADACFGQFPHVNHVSHLAGYVQGLLRVRHPLSELFVTGGSGGHDKVFIHNVLRLYGLTGLTCQGIGIGYYGGPGLGMYVSLNNVGVGKRLHYYCYVTKAAVGMVHNFIGGAAPDIKVYVGMQLSEARYPFSQKKRAVSFYRSDVDKPFKAVTHLGNVCFGPILYLKHLRRILLKKNTCFRKP